MLYIYLSDLISNICTPTIFIAYTNKNTLYLFVDKFVVYHLSEYKLLFFTIYPNINFHTPNSSTLPI